MVSCFWQQFMLCVVKSKTFFTTSQYIPRSQVSYSTGCLNFCWIQNQYSAVKYIPPTLSHLWIDGFSLLQPRSFHLLFYKIITTFENQTTQADASLPLDRNVRQEWALVISFCHDTCSLLVDRWAAFLLRFLRVHYRAVLFSTTWLYEWAIRWKK